MIEVEKIMSSSLITISDDLKKSALQEQQNLLYSKTNKFVHYLLLLLINSPEELRVTKSPSFEIAKPKKFCDFIKD